MLPHLICVPQKLENDIEVSSPHSLAYYLNIHINLIEKLTGDEVIKKFSVSYGIQTFTAVFFWVPDEFIQLVHRIFQ
jgi:hypothetical protein